MTEPAPTDEQRARAEDLMNFHGEGVQLARYAARTEAALSSARAENAALRESRDVTAERAAGDRRALDEARDAMAAALDEHEPAGEIITGIPPSCPSCRVYAPCATYAALAAAQPTESAPPLERSEQPGPTPGRGRAVSCLL